MVKKILSLTTVTSKNKFYKLFTFEFHKLIFSICLFFVVLLLVFKNNHIFELIMKFNFFSYD